MVWPSPVYPGNPILASQFNGLLSTFSTWADAMNAVFLLQTGGGIFGGAVVFNGVATFAVAPAFTDAPGTRSNLGVPSLSGSNVFTQAASNLNSFISTLSAGVAGLVVQNDVGAFVSARSYGSTASTVLAGITLANWGALYHQSGNGLLLDVVPSMPMVFATANVERARFVGAGRFLLGTVVDDGSNLLQVAGGALFTATLTATATTVSAAAIQAKVAGQAGIDLWNAATGGTPTPAGGARWRLFADNVGGGGGSLTMGFFDIQNGRVAGGWDNSGWFNCSFGLNLTNSANLNFGTNFQTFTPALTASGSMTVSGLTVQEARYLRIGPFVIVSLSVTFNLGGSASNNIYLTFPVAGAMSASSLVPLSAGFYFPPAAGSEVGFGYATAGQLTFARSNGANFPIQNSVQLFLGGIYRVV